MWIVIAVAAGRLPPWSHTAPAPFLFDVIAGRRSVWHMPNSAAPTISSHLRRRPVSSTTTPDLLDVLARERVRATFFLIDRHITDETSPIVRRMFDDGHGVAVHSAHARLHVDVIGYLREHDPGVGDHIERLTGQGVCVAFRPHAGWRTWSMYRGLKKVGLPDGGLELGDVGLGMNFPRARADSVVNPDPGSAPATATSS